MKVLCIIADVVDSRALKNRAGFQKKLSRVLSLINDRSSSLLSPYTITLGDEFQAVYGSAQTLFQDIVFLQRSIYPVRIRFAIGLGELSTPINARQAIGMDGPAFHRAREGILSLKESGSLYRVVLPEGGRGDWLNPVLDLMSHQTGGWKSNRWMIYERLLDGQTPKEIARAAGVTATAVYKNIHAGALFTLVRLCREVSEVLGAKMERK